MDDDMTRRTARRVAMIVFGAALVAPPAHGQQFIQTGRDTLRGLPGVEVIVEPLAPELQQGGVTGAAIRTSVEGQLRAAGIPVYPSQADNQSAAKPYLYVQLSGLALPPQAYVLAVQVQLRQTLRSIVTSSNVVNAMSWDQQVVVVIPGSLQPVVGEVQTLVNAFIADWRSVH